jgi:hypothetical protein
MNNINNNNDENDNENDNENKYILSEKEKIYCKKCNKIVNNLKWIPNCINCGIFYCGNKCMTDDNKYIPNEKWKDNIFCENCSDICIKCNNIKSKNKNIKNKICKPCRKKYNTYCYLVLYKQGCSKNQKIYNLKSFQILSICQDQKEVKTQLINYYNDSLNNDNNLDIINYIKNIKDVKNIYINKNDYNIIIKKYLMNSINKLNLKFLQ